MNPVKQPWKIWVNISHEALSNDNTTLNSPMKTNLHFGGYIAFRPNDTMSLSGHASNTISSNCGRSTTTSIWLSSWLAIYRYEIALSGQIWDLPWIGDCPWCQRRISIPGTAFPLTTFASQFHFDGINSFRCDFSPYLGYICNFCIFHDSTLVVSYAKFVTTIPLPFAWA